MLPLKHKIELHEKDSEEVEREIQREMPAMFQIFLYFPLKVLIFVYEHLYFYFIPLILFGLMTFDDSVSDLSKEKKDDGHGNFYKWVQGGFSALIGFSFTFAVICYIVKRCQ